MYDLIHYFLPAARALLAGQSPYDVAGFYNPPWALAPVLAALLPGGIGIYFGLSLVVLAYVAYRRGASPLNMALVVTAPPVLQSYYQGNLEWLALAGLLLPPRWGLLLLAIKPQVGAGAAAWWVWDAWRRGGWRLALATVWPLAAALAASFVVFGWWPAAANEAPALAWNVSYWPLGLVGGLVMLSLAARREDGLDLALAAGPLLSPYVAFSSYAGCVLALASRRRELVIAWLALWGVALARLP